MVLCNVIFVANVIASKWRLSRKLWLSFKNLTTDTFFYRTFFVSEYIFYIQISC